MLLSLALVLIGAALGWTALFSFVVAPGAFKDLDRGRADRYVRNIIQSGHLIPAALCVAAAAAAFLGRAPGAALVAIVTACLFVVARFAIAPGARRRSITRVLASGITALLMPMTAAGAALAAFGV